MKNLRLLVITATLFAVALSASAQTKFASVDMKKLFNGYYKTKMAQAAMDKERSDLTKEIKDMSDALTKARADYKQMLDQANDQGISADERDKRKQSAADKAKDVNSRQVAIEQYSRQADAQLNDKSQRMISNLVGEIQKAVADKAKAGGYTLVVNSANNEAFVYVGTETDISAAVLAQLNAGAPIDVVRPAGMLNISTNAP
ncbi:MAG: OmpH family outer membrane protein [Verrucomicrobiae bacterium]|nr:OmpH family outer membrane protein [Verrucomicrobiae bacterium]